MQNHFKRAQLIAWLLIAPAAGWAQSSTQRVVADGAASSKSSGSTARPSVQAAMRASGIAMDGVLDEAAWSGASIATGFMQQDPKEGELATQQTEVRFVYDEEALYIGARMFDDQGSKGVRTYLSRRDQQRDGDYLMFVLDTYHDHSGRTVFQINPSGVKYDAGQASPNADPSWDPVWEVVTKIDDKGWTAELRIPFAQLRFPKDSVQTWGMQIWRYVERLNETSMWAFWGKNESGGPQLFGHLEAIQTTPRRGGMELMPYVVGKAAYVEPGQSGSPFQDGSEIGWRAGGDLKMLLTSTLTLDATFNPDFGQVEVDPAVVNLSAFETFFEERRPFFVSGGGMFGFGGFSCFYCSNVSSMSLFYSRRIGRNPQGSVSSDAEYTYAPDNTTILGAAKVTGRTSNGLQVGVLNAVTASETAKAITDAGTTFEEEVEPLTNYFVGRAKKNYRNGDYTFGVIATSVARNFDNPTLEALIPGHAEAVGVDWQMQWQKRVYSFMGNIAMSSVTGSESALERLQVSSARYFNRPDREHGSNGLFTDKLDENMTSMRGFGGYARIAKNSGNWMGEVQTNFRSPGFEVNDMAFLTRADYVWMNANLVRAFTKPTKYYRRLDFIAGAQQQFNFDGDLNDRQLHVWAGTETPFFWSLTGSYQLRPRVLDDRLTRGGAVVERAQGQSAWFDVSTDSRKRVVFGFGPNWGWNEEGARSFSTYVDMRIKPATNLSITFSPSYSRSEGTAQFVRKFDDATATNFYGQRAVFADIEQRTLSFNTRLSATFTPTLTLELVAQPFVSTGDYSNFKEFVTPRALTKQSFTSNQLTTRTDTDGSITYVLDPDNNAATSNFEFANPDFNFRSLRGNAVLRWEYRPGSTLFLVWQQERSGSSPIGDFNFSRDTGALFDERSDNIFLIKMSYWLPR
jgi:hypothetical protein